MYVNLIPFWNEDFLNTQMMENRADTQRAQEIILYKFRDLSYLIEALHAPGAGCNCINGRNTSDGNRRLALLGDSVMKVVLLDGWYAVANNRCEAPSMFEADTGLRSFSWSPRPAKSDRRP